MHDLILKDQHYVWHPFDALENEQPLVIEKSEGVYLITTDGRYILDAISSWWVNLHGHAHPHLVQAISQQAALIDHVIFAGFTHAPAIQLSERLLAILPNNLAKIFFADDGSTAVEVALKMAFQYFYSQNIPKTKLIALEGCYHGDTFGAMSAAGKGTFNKPFSPFLFDVLSVELPSAETIDEVEEKVVTYLQTGEVAAFIYEPLVQGAAGMRTYPSVYLERLLRLVKKYGALCIADEVMTGFGRTETLFASEQMSTPPDLLCMSKGITGGTLPLGAVAVSSAIVNVLQHQTAENRFLHGHSYTGNPIACAVANASLDLLLDPECKQNRARIIGNHRSFALKIRASPTVKEIRVCGTILAVEFTTVSPSGYFNKLKDYLYHYFLKRNILLRPLGNVLYILPPYIITDEQLQKVYDAISDFCNEMQIHKKGQ